MRRNQDMRFLLTVGVFLVVSVVIVFLVRIRAANLFRLPVREWSVLGDTATYRTLAKGDEAILEEEIVAASFRDIEAIFDSRNPSSLLSQLNKTAGVDGSYVQVRATSELLHLLLVATRIAEETDGDFDPTAGPLTGLWLSRTARGTTPTETEIETARRLVDWRAVRITMTGPFAQLSLRDEGMRLDMETLARAYAVDLVYHRLKEAGAKDFLVTLSGNYRAGGNRYKNRKGWPIELLDPAGSGNGKAAARRWLEDGDALSLRGPDRRFLQVPSSIRPLAIDPRDGNAILGQRPSIGVVARNAMIANGYATAIYVVGPDRGGEFLAKEHGLLELIVLGE